MPQLSLSRWLLTFLLALGSLTAAQATHVQGGDISYITIASTTPGVPRYHVVVRLFANLITVPLSLGPSINLMVRRANNCSTGAPNGFTVPAMYSQVTHGLPLTCTTGASIYDVNLFATDLDLPLPLGPWSLSIYLDTQVTQNMPNSIDQIVDAFLDNSLTRNRANTSPQFESVLQPIINAGLPIPPYSFSTFDPDGDSLSYELILPRKVFSTTATTGCFQPIASSSLAPGFALNTATGALLPMVAPAPAPSQGYYTMTVRVSEYRKLNGQWQLIGYVVRSMLYMLYTTSNQAPSFTTLSLNGGPAQSPALPIAAYPGQTVHITLSATDPDPGQLLRFASEAPNVVPGLTLTTLNATQARLDWTLPTGIPAGRYAIAVAVLDSGCPYSASEERTLTFEVNSQPLAARATITALAPAYPTPFREQVQFAAPAGQLVTVIDALGRVVAQLTSAADGRVRWQPAATLSAGLYLARSADGQPLARLLRADN